MKRTFLFVATAITLLVSCGEAGQDQAVNSASETSKTVEKEAEEAPVNLAAINDESRKVDGAVECITQQFQLVQEGKFDEALEYYAKKRREKIKAELDADPSIKKQWQAGTKLSDEDFNKMIESVKQDQSFFTFEEGMWRRLDR